jgi:hypothetical protein
MFVRKRRRRDSIRKPDTIDRILSSHSSLNPNEGSHEMVTPKPERSLKISLTH